MKVVINDANILIDLFRLDLIEAFFNLQNLDLQTTDFVFEELHDEQKDVLQKFIQNQSLMLIESSDDDLNNIFQILSQTKGLSVEDCSVWYHAKKNSGIFLTGDAKLRNNLLLME